MPQNDPAAPVVPAAAPEEDVVEVLADAGEKVRVKRKTLLLSPVIRQTLETRPENDRKPIIAGPNVINIEIEAPAAAVKWLFGLIEGKPFSELGITEAQNLAEPPSPESIHRARDLADRYDIPFFDPILTEAMWKLASMGTYYAVTAMGVGCSMANQSLCRFAVSNMTGLPIPYKLPYSSFAAMGNEAAWAIMTAVAECKEFCSCEHPAGKPSSYPPSGCLRAKWTSSHQQWLEISRSMKFPGR